MTKLHVHAEGKTREAAISEAICVLNEMLLLSNNTVVTRDDMHGSAAVVVFERPDTEVDEMGIRL